MSIEISEKSVKYFTMSKCHKHANAVLDETETTLTIQKLGVVQEFDPFTSTIKDHIVLDSQYPVRTESKNDLSAVFDDVELTTDYWQVFEYLTGKKRKAVSVNTVN